MLISLTLSIFFPLSIFIFLQLASLIDVQQNNDHNFFEKGADGMADKKFRTLK